MTFIKDLNRLRNAAATGNLGGVNAADADKVKVDGGLPQPAVKEPELRGAQGRPVAKKAQGLSGAALRTTVGDVFAAAERLGIPSAMIAKYASGMDQHVASLKDSAERIERSIRGLDPKTQELARGLAARLVLAMGRGLAAMDQTSAGVQIKQLAEATAEMLEGPRKLGGAHIRGLEVLAHATSQLNNGDLAGELKRAAKSVLGKPDGAAVNAAVLALDAAMPTIVGASDLATRAPLFRAAVEAALLAAHDAQRPAADVATLAIAGAKAQLTELQPPVLAQFVDTVRAKRAELDAQNGALDAQLAGVRQAYQANLAGPGAEKLAPLAGLVARAEEQLSAGALALWYEQLNAHLGQPAGVLGELARIHLEHLAHAGTALPTREVTNQISQTAIALANTPGVTPEALARFAEGHVRSQDVERLPGTLAVLRELVVGLAGKNVQLRSAEDLATLANALIGRTDALAAQNGPAVQVLAALAAAPDDAAWAQALRHGPRFAAVLASAEPGPARDLLQASFAEDVKVVAAKGLDLGALAGANKTLPEDGLAHFVAVAVKHGVDPDGFLEKLGALVKHAKGNKEHIRAIRNFVTLADHAGADVPKFIDTLLAGKPKSPVVTRTISALLQENNLQFTPEQINTAIAMLERGENVAAAIEARLHDGMVKKLNLNQLLQDAKVKVTATGYAEVTGSLAQFFSLGANANTVDKGLLKGMLIATLEDKYDAFRFTTPPAKKQLADLTAEQQRAWMKPEVMTHVRFDAAGKEAFDKRVTSAAAIGGKLLANMTAVWGELDVLRGRQKELAAQLRNIDKNDRAARLPLTREINDLPMKIDAMSWAKELAGMTPETTTPLRFAELGEKLPGLARLLGPAFDPVVNELAWTIRIDDLSYSQVVTNDGPDLSTMYRLATSQCLRGWPQDAALLAYCVDANKRMIVTKNQAGEERRAMMRLVARTDEGHVGEPMLVLERAYPDNQTEEEKQRLVEHMLRRAVEMGISAAYPTEYYWDSAKTARHIMDMNRVLEDLNRRYDTTSKIEVTKVTSRAGNVNPEYIDSAPLGGVGNAGVVGIRRYNGQQDNTYENRFLILTPNRD